ncbi:MAG: purine-nucleoside phosphorylase [Desulfitibacter sp. BRH_c19]|nr:MAG: purine-nucleoside phosphorylase [Desulfitibacter sp. BRH_c19]
MINKIIRELEDTKKYILNSITDKPDIGIILGSGLGVMAEEIKNKTTLPYNKIPHFPITTVEGHKGQMIVGDFEGKKVVAMQGRFHYYEGYSMADVVYPVRVMGQLGIKNLIITNAAGGINLDFQPGDLMVIKDHINLMGVNPLMGKNIGHLGERFPDMSEAYNLALREIALATAKDLTIDVRKGVYAAVTGPSYETPAEIRYLRSIGADAVGMSTVPETIAANHMGIKVLGISCITNMAAGVLDAKLNHEEVVETANKVKDKFINVLRGVVRRL